MALYLVTGGDAWIGSSHLGRAVLEGGDAVLENFAPGRRLNPARVAADSDLHTGSSLVSAE